MSTQQRSGTACRCGALTAAAFLLGLAPGVAAGGALPWPSFLTALALLSGGVGLGVALTLRRAPKAPAVVPESATADRPADGSCDALTGLPSRSLFLARLQTVVGGDRHGDRMAAVLILDLRRFGSINLEFGHVAGDLLLRHVATRLLARLRERDTLARLGADRFAIIQSEIDGAPDALGLGERLLAALDEPFDLLGQLTAVEAAIGVALHARDSAGSADELLARASTALDRARSLGKSAICFDDVTIESALRDHAALLEQLGHALERDEIDLRYRPRFDLASRHLTAVEAQPCWHVPEQGALPPERFMPLAETSGAIAAIGDFVLDRAVQDVARWRQAGAPGLCTVIAISPVQLDDSAFVARVRECLARADVEPAALQLQIEAARLSELSTGAHQTLADLETAGIGLALADLPKEGGSLLAASRLPLTQVRLDHAVTGDIPHDVTGAALVRAVVAFADGLGAETVADQVESEEQLASLRSVGCRSAQGPYFGPTLHAREVDLMVEASGASGQHDTFGEAPGDASRKIIG